MSKNIKGCLTSTTDNWKTPTWLYEIFMKKGYIDTFQYECTYNELEMMYKDKKLYCNPPFSQLKTISEWLIKQYKRNCTIALLIPSRTDTQYFHDLAKLNPLIIFIKARLHYNDSKRVAPFPSMLLIFRPNINLLGIQTYMCMTQQELKRWLTE